ncbi:MAG: glycoside hydrolase family 31 protein [Promethearchaeia archaeon]
MVFSKSNKDKFASVGNIEAVEEIERGITLEFKNGTGKIFILSPEVFRFVISFDGEFDLQHSYAVIKSLEKWEKCEYDIDISPKKVTITTESLICQIARKPYQLIIRENKPNGNVLCEDLEDGLGACIHQEEGIVRSYKNLQDKTHFYGFGEKTGPLDKKAEHLIMHGRDLPYKGDTDPLYQNHPYFIHVRKGIAHAVFLDNISKTTFDMGNKNEEEYYFDVATGNLNYYFLYGPTIDEILRRYTELTGRIEMPPKWSIGYHQCRYSYKNEEEIRQITSKFREYNIPCDGIWFDIHYMRGYRCFTFDHERFPDPDAFMDELKQDGFKPVVIVDPGIKVDEDYQIYQELIENEYYTPKDNGEPSIGLVWPGLTHFPDFTREEVREWWADKHKFYFDLGVEGIWNDMNEPAFTINPVKSKIKRMDHKDMYLDNQGRHTPIEACKNIYALCEAMGTRKGFKKHMPNTRPFILTRSGYAGIQRYAAIWTGDNWTNWTNITLAIRMLVNLNLSAQVFVGSDVGGFTGLLKYILHDKKQFIRWIQSGIFYPFCRVHTAFGTKSQDPFSYGEKAQEISRKYIELRYKLLPYWYTLFYKAFTDGAPILRPLFYHTLEDENCFDEKFENQFFLGEDILIIPIGKRRIKSKSVYLPKGKWVHFWTQEEFEGGKTHVIPITLEDIPIFIRKGAIIPMQEPVEYVGQKPIETLILKIYVGDPGTSTSFTVYEDDGDSMDYANKELFCTLTTTCQFEDNNCSLTIKPLQGSYTPSWENIQYELYANGEKKTEDIISFDRNGKKINISF